MGNSGTVQNHVYFINFYKGDTLKFPNPQAKAITAAYKNYKRNIKKNLDFICLSKIVSQFRLMDLIIFLISIPALCFFDIKKL